MKQKNLLLLLIALLLPFGLWAQNESSNTNKEAEELFASTFPLGIYISGKTFSYNEKGDSGSFNHSYSSVWMPNIGITYSFYQKGRFNFNTSIGGTIFKEYYYSYDENIYDLNSYTTDKLLLYTTPIL
ncbi:MAG TPA: hypothetical protein VKX30_02430 [Flavobacteriaceae bacterium]|nr:hypothetical protein [Flavobacteriaceae bacterium]